MRFIKAEKRVHDPEGDYVMFGVLDSETSKFYSFDIGPLGQRDSILARNESFIDATVLELNDGNLSIDRYFEIDTPGVTVVL